jgi:hypothetical protein
MAAFGTFWHLAVVQIALMTVRFDGNNGHDADVTRCLLMTQSGHPGASGFQATTPKALTFGRDATIRSIHHRAVLSSSYRFA